MRRFVWGRLYYGSLSDKSQASRTRRLSGDGETGVWGRRISTKKMESQDKLTHVFVTGNGSCLRTPTREASVYGFIFAHQTV